MAVNHAVIVHCPACATGYLLPRVLLGSLGARVTCPACREGFDVDRDGSPLVPEAAAAPGGRLLAPGIAAAVLDELAGRAGPAIGAAAREGRLFRDHGPGLLEAFDEYRRRAGPRSGAEAFREELRRRWGLELLPRTESRV